MERINSLELEEKVVSLGINPENIYAVNVDGNSVRLLANIELLENDERVELYSNLFELPQYEILEDIAFSEIVQNLRSFISGGIQFDYEENKEAYGTVYDCFLYNVFGEEPDNYNTFILSCEEFAEVFDVLRDGNYIMCFV